LIVLFYLIFFCQTMSNFVKDYQHISLWRNISSKTSITLVFFVYCIGIFSQLIISLTSSTAYAATSQPLQRLIAVIVDQSLYQTYQTQIDRYASEYVQAQYSESKALIIPIQAQNFQAHDIHKMLQNLYFEWQRDVPSQLIWVTLIWDIPLSVVNDNGYYYPTIYPYVDFVSPQFVYSEQDQIFLPNSQWSLQNPEIWHNIIRFTTNNEYAAYFAKLAQYAARPVSRVSDKVWVDDIISAKQSYDQSSLRNYTDQFVFAEDLARQRYTNLLLDITNAKESSEVLKLFDEVSRTSVWSSSADELSIDAQQQQEDVQQNLKSYFEWITKLTSLLRSRSSTSPGVVSDSNVGLLSSTQNVPTLFLQQIMDWYLKDYYELYSDEYHASINDMVLPSGRYYNSWDRVGINSHIWKTYQHDELTKTIITNLNDQLESSLDQSIDEIQAYMYVPIPTKMLSYRRPTTSILGAPLDGLVLANLYDVSYFGSDPLTSNNIQDMMIFRWTFLNLTWSTSLSWYDYRQVPLMDRDRLLNRSLGASYGVQSREVEANRWYNLLLAESDQEHMSELKKMILPWDNECTIKGLDDQQRYIQWYWWWYTPMNINSGHIQQYWSLSLDLTKMDYTAIWSPSYAIGGATFGGTVYDIAWSKIINPQYRMLWVVEGTQEYVVTSTVDPNWKYPDSCDTQWQFSGAMYQEINDLNLKINQECTGINDACQTLRWRLNELTSDIQQFESQNGSWVAACIPREINVITEYKPQTKQNILLSWISNNYLAYQNFASVQWTAYRPKTSLEPRVYAHRTDDYIYRFDGQDGLNVLVARSVQWKSIKPVLYCAKEDNSNLFEWASRKRIYAYSTVDFFENVARAPRRWEYLRMMIDQWSGVNSTTSSRYNELLAQSCDKFFEDLTQKEEEFSRVSQQLEQTRSTQIRARISWLVRLSQLRSEIEGLRNSNLSCMNMSDPYHYQSGFSLNNKQAWDPNAKYEFMNDYYYVTMPTIYIHKAPTAADLYWKELKILRDVQFNYPVPDTASMRKEWKRREQYDIRWYSYDWLKFEVDSISFILDSEEFTRSANRVYFDSRTTLNLYGKSVSLANTMWILSGNTLILTGSDAPLSRWEQEQGGRSLWSYPRYGGMNMSTSDRPIDSVRHMSFQWIGWDLVTLSYPNLYNVSVFDDRWFLKTEEQIKDSIKEYLVEKAKAYRQQLQDQQNKSQQFYWSNKKAFDILGAANPYASPNRQYSLEWLTDDFFIKALAMTVGTVQFTSDDVISILARHLYYQNLPTPVLSRDIIFDKDLDQVYTSSSLDNNNSKRRFIFDTYLRANSHKQWLQSRIRDWSLLSWLFLPGYDIQWYEIVSLRSDGEDYHVDNQLDPRLRQFQLSSDMSRALPRVEPYQERIAPLVCNGRTLDIGWVPLLQYPQAFQCWLNDIKNSSITLTVNGDLVDLISSAATSGIRAAISWYFVDQRSAIQAWVPFGQDILQMPYERAWLVQSVIWTWSQWWQQFQAWRWNLKTSVQTRGYDSEQMTINERKFARILSSLVVSSDAQLAADGTWLLTLWITSLTDPYTLSLSSTWSACLLLNWLNTCQTTVRLANWWTSLTWNRATYRLQVAPWSELWDAWLVMNICSTGGDQTCIQRVHMYRIMPWSLARVDVLTPLNGAAIAYWSQIPLVMQGYDSVNRPLSTVTDPYRIMSDRGLMTYMWYSVQQLDLDSRNGFSVLYTSPTTWTSDRIRFTPTMKGGLSPVLTYDLPLAPASLTISDRQWPVSLQQWIQVQLPSQPGIYTMTWLNGDVTLVSWQIPLISLALDKVNGRSVMWLARLSSQNWLVSFGTISVQRVSTGWRVANEAIWSAQDTFVLSDNSQQIYLYPSYRSGRDVITVTVWDRSWSIPVVVRPWSPAWVLLDAPNSLWLAQTWTVSVRVTDYWGNPLDTATWVDVQTFGYKFDLVASPQITERNPDDTIKAVQTVWGQARISLYPQYIVGKWYITARIRDVALDKQRTSYAGVSVQSSLRPSTWLNAMILDLKGSDRWTLDVSARGSYAASRLISQSDKLLSIHTSLVDPTALQQSLLVIHPNGWLYGQYASSMLMTLSQWDVMYRTSDNRVMVWWEDASLYPLFAAGSGVIQSKPSIQGMYYISRVEDSTIQTSVEANVVRINDVSLIDMQLGRIHPDAQIVHAGATIYGAWIWNVVYRGRVVGQLVQYRSAFRLQEAQSIMDNQVLEWYQIKSWYVQWSTSGPIWIHIVSRDTSYETILSSNQTQWLIAQFGQGRSVGESTMYAWQFDILYWDAALSKNTKNVPAYALVDASIDATRPLPVTKDLPYDTWIGQLIFRDSSKSIDRVMSIDFNNDNLKDMLVSYTDGSLRLLKNYWWKQPRRDLWNLMVIADWVKQLYVGDVDRNDYEDIIVHTQDNKLRVYYNRRWEFGVDWYPVCLDIPWGPDTLSQLHYWTIRDMDNDGGIDIVTYDYRWDVKVFYGGRWWSSRWSSYVSELTTWCDPDWQRRQESTLVQSFGMNIMSNPIADDSLLHWASHINASTPYTNPSIPLQQARDYNTIDDLQWLSDAVMPVANTEVSSQIDLSDFTADLPQWRSDYSAEQFASGVSTNAINSFNASSLASLTYWDATRYVPVPSVLAPTYQQADTPLYIPARSLNPYDPFQTNKTFTDLNGWVLVDRDLVRVTVSIRGLSWVQFAYLEKLTGPRVVPLNDRWTLEWMSGDVNQLLPSLTYNTNGYIFMINGAQMDDDGQMQLSYIVQYRAQKLVDLEVISVSDSMFPVIQASSLDGCQKTQWQYRALPLSPRRYSMGVIDYNTKIIEQQQASYKSYDVQTQQQIKDMTYSVGTDGGIFDYVKEQRNNANVFGKALGIIDGTYLQSIPTQFRIWLASGSREQQISRQISDFTNRLCNGFKPGASSCAGITPPWWLPFNMAIPGLTPGVVNAMWYWVMYDWWLPLVAFPLKTTPFIRPPQPLWAGWWLSIYEPVMFKDMKNAAWWSPLNKDNSAINWPINRAQIESQFRFYATPTLTTAFWFAFCFGPYDVWMKARPSPFKEVVGNCVVFATNPLLKWQQQCSVASQPNYTPPPQVQLPTCMWNLTTDLSRISPTQMVLLDDQAQAWLETQRLTSPSDLYYNATYYGGDARETYAASHPWVAKAIQLSNSVIVINRPAQIANTSELFCLGSCGGERTLDEWINNFMSTRSSQWLDVALQWTQASVRQIGKGIKKWLYACVEQIAANQVKYAAHNLLTSQLRVIFPDMSSLWIIDDVWTIQSNISWLRSDAQTSGMLRTFVDRDMINAVSGTYRSTQSLISTMNQVEFNPFRPIEQLFNDMQLVSISHKDILVQVPYLSYKDSVWLRSQLSWWIERNVLIAQQWSEYWSWLAQECTQLSDPVKRRECEALLSQVIDVNDQIGQLKRSVQTNLTMIRQYEHYTRISLPNWQEQHMVYLTEATNLINSTMAQLAAWSTQNSARFTSWAGAIRSMIVAVKTRQLLIDYAVNRKERCGTCRVDNYDFSTCSLTGLCPNFPLFNWPSFRTPDVSIDLSNINAWIDVVLPRVRFTPINVPWSRALNLWDLPMPPQLGSPFYVKIDIILPTLPIIPAPPPLPTLPSLSMNVDMDLPLLPPAPKIPALPETLQAAVQVADFVWQLLCIVKWDVGLVWEKFVKNKIEQITARTWEVQPFDSIAPVINQPRPQWYNVRVDSYVNLRFYFDGLYNVFDDLGEQYNQSIDVLKWQFDSYLNQGYDFIQWARSELRSIVPFTGSQLPPLRYEARIVPLSSQEFDTRVAVVLKQFAVNIDDSRLQHKASTISSTLDTPINAVSNIQWLSEVQSQANGLITSNLLQAQKQYQAMVSDYDSWLESLTVSEYVSDTSEQTVLSTSLYRVDPEFKNLVESSSIATDYLEGNKLLLDRHIQTLDKSTPQSLWMTQSKWSESRDYLIAMSDLTDRALLAQESRWELIRSPGELIRDTASDDGWGSLGTSAWWSSVIPPRSKIYEPIWFDQTDSREWYLVDIVVPTSRGEISAAVDVIKPSSLGTLYRSRSFKEDMNNNPRNGADIILWDEHAIYIKYANQNDITWSHNTRKTIYRLPLLNSPEQLADLTRSSDGYLAYDPGILSRSQWFRLWSPSYAITNFTLQWQWYENMMFQWSNPVFLGQAKQEIYLIRFTQLVDRFADRMGPENRVKYVIVSSNPLDDTTRIVLPGTSRARTIQDLKRSDIVHDIMVYDPTQTTIQAILYNVDRQWHYAQVLRMHAPDGIYLRSSPWSNQHVWWYQIAADTSAPVPEVILKRVATDEVIWWGTSLQWYINTNYELHVTWKDTVWLSRTSMWWSANGATTRTTITKIYEQVPQTLQYTFAAVDSSNNTATVTVSVKLDSPQLETTTATPTDGSWWTITAQLTPDVDDGVVVFQQQNGPSWINLVWMPWAISWYVVQPLKTVFTGWLYQFPNAWWLRSSDWGLMWSINPWWQVQTQTLELLVTFPQWYPLISMMNSSWVVQYELTYAPQTLTGSIPIDIKTPNQYRLLSLQNFNAAIVWEFAGWRCIAPQLWECEIYVSKQWDIWVDPLVRSNYYGTYLSRNGHGVYQIMRDQTFVAEINLVTKDIQ